MDCIVVVRTTEATGVAWSALRWTATSVDTARQDQGKRAAQRRGGGGVGVLVFALVVHPYRLPFATNCRNHFRSMGGNQQVVAAFFFSGESKKMRFVCPETARTSRLRVITFPPAYARSSTRIRKHGHRGGGGVDESDLPKADIHTQVVVMKPDSPLAVLRMARGLK